MSPTKLLACSSVLVIWVVASSCGSHTKTADKSRSAENQAAEAGLKINGAGATFPAPVYAAWAGEYKKASNIELNYQAIGSGGGIKQIESRTVDFGASDDPLKREELQKNGLMQFPAIIGGVVLAYNLPDFTGQIRLDGPTVARIFSGAITKWNDPAIARLNPGAKLPSTALTPVYRSDASGTTFIFTNYLSKVSPEWKAKIGNDKSVSWPTGIGGKGNPGVAAFLKQTPGGIGYVEFAYAKSNGLPTALLRNQANQFVEPSTASFAAAAANAKWNADEGFYVILTDQPGEQTWPIVGASFILVPRKPENPERTKAVFGFFDYALKHGAAAAEKLNYVPLPSAVTSKIESAWSTATDGARTGG
ncbi:MAG TPA: phosphate ABC transporter substrate-binding protein PstS [Bryobacteraceae bacterium]|nr:phosphate ABC transporter substrate-binding protein PstS [Bryobacteraceae bacterium]